MNLLEINLFKHCEVNKSGVAFISTNNNKACRIIVVDGRLIAVNMGRINGFDALLELEKAGIKAASFKESMELSYKDEEKIESSDSALRFLGYSGSSIKHQEFVDDSIPREKEEKKKTVRMYRGQIVED